MKLFQPPPLKLKSTPDGKILDTPLGVPIIVADSKQKDKMQLVAHKYLNIYDNDLNS